MTPVFNRVLSVDTEVDPRSMRDSLHCRQEIKVTCVVAEQQAAGSCRQAASSFRVPRQHSPTPSSVPVLTVRSLPRFVARMAFGRARAHRLESREIPRYTLQS